MSKKKSEKPCSHPLKVWVYLADPPLEIASMLPALPTNFIKRATESERLELLENGELSRAGETIQDNDHASGGRDPGAGRHRVEVVAEDSGPGYMTAYTAVHRAILCAGLFALPTANSINFPTQSAITAAETIREMMTPVSRFLSCVGAYYSRSLRTAAQHLHSPIFLVTAHLSPPRPSLGSRRCTHGSVTRKERAKKNSGGLLGQGNPWPRCASPTSSDTKAARSWNSRKNQKVDESSQLEFDNPEKNAERKNELGVTRRTLTRRKEIASGQ
ncbi:hypothetical protein B0H11DRAFT_1917736 [Mycena galericulata]|nr:hypothetical protein B0H11DRAFT_1917736 [Mycena galericulata]